MFSAELSKKIYGCNILLTGASGFFEKWLLNSLTIANNRYSACIKLTCLSRNPDRLWNNTCKKIITTLV